MTNHASQNCNENPSIAKRKRVLDAVAREIVVSEDDDDVADSMDICNIIKNQTDQRRQTATSSALHALGETIKNTLLDINEIREQNRERRHRELLQLLKKMVPPENTAKNEASKSTTTNLTNENLNEDRNIHTNEYVVEQDYVKNGFSSADEVTNNSCSSRTFENNLDHSHRSSGSANDTTSTNVKLLHKPQISKDQTNKIKQSVIAVKHDTKNELKKMREQMLELQRQKMEDRERKKREFIQLQNM